MRSQLTERLLETVRQLHQLGLGVFPTPYGIMRPGQYPAQATTQRRPVYILAMQLPVPTREQAGVHGRLHTLDQRRQVITPGRVAHAQLAIAAVAMAAQKTLESLRQIRLVRNHAAASSTVAR